MARYEWRLHIMKVHSLVHVQACLHHLMSSGILGCCRMRTFVTAVPGCTCTWVYLCLYLYLYLYLCTCVTAVPSSMRAS